MTIDCIFYIIQIAEKLGILDVIAILNDNTIMDIELQVRDENNITERGIQYLTKLFILGKKYAII